jgi:pyruvate formate-lyase 1-activating enzyme
MAECLEKELLPVDSVKEAPLKTAAHKDTALERKGLNHSCFWELKNAEGIPLAPVHSMESFGSVDGPGTRFIVFLQGCAMRCLYCHNPDTWAFKKENLMTPEEVLKKAIRYQDYWGKEGGITVSGGDPLLHIDFLLALFRLAKKKGINTCLDTSAQPFSNKEPFYEKFLSLMEVTDTVLLDIKAMDSDLHKKLTGHPNLNILDCGRLLSTLGVNVWIRHVLVPGLTDSKEELLALKQYISTLHNVKKLEILPYHTMGVVKYESLGIPYPLKGVPDARLEEVQRAEKILGL